MRPIVLEYLKTHSFKELYEEHGIKARRSADGIVISLNYDQLTVKNGAPISNETRGLVIRPVEQLLDDAWEDVVVGECEVVARPFDRFYNLGDPAAADIDWDTAVAQDKLDGTMISLYYSRHKKRWMTATRSVPEADLPMNEDGLTFNQLFMTGLERTLMFYTVTGFFDLLDHLGRDRTYVFELTSPLNRVVVKYDVTSVTLLTIRENESGDEIDPRLFDKFNGLPPVVGTHELDILDSDSVQAFVKTFQPDKNEGVVLRDAEGRRLKVKSPAYVLNHRFTDALRVSRRDILLAVLDGTMDDILPLLDSNVRKHVDELQEKVLGWMQETDIRYQTFVYKAAGDKKKFALLVQASGLWHPLFYELNKKKHATTRELVDHMVSEGRVQKTMLDTIIEILKWNPVV